MPEPLVSVVIPVFGGERFLADALDSVAAQTHTRVQVIVVDDGSPDESAQIAAARSGVTLLREPHRGVAAARNAGLAVAQGELVAFLDQDDEWLPHKLATQVARLGERTELDFVLCHMEVTLVPGTSRPDWFEPVWLRESQAGYVPSAWLVRREAFARVGAFDTTFQVACDGDWLARAKDAGMRSEILPDTLVRWRIHGANGSYDQATMRLETMRMLRRSVRRQRAAEHA